MKATCINAIDDQSLKVASDIIRDGEFADGDFRFDSPQHTVTLSLWKADEELSSFEREGLFVRWRISPMRRLELSFRSVMSVEFIRKSSGTSPHPIGGIRWNNGEAVYIDTYDGLTVGLTISKLDGTLLITGDIDPSRSQRSRSSSLFGRERQRGQEPFP